MSSNKPVDSNHPADILGNAPKLPLTDEHWQAIVQEVGFSPREAQVAELALRELTNKQIADCLGISHKTVEGYFHSRIPKKTGASNRVQLYRFVVSIALSVQAKRCPCEHCQCYHRQCYHRQGRHRIAENENDS